jgi:hypothetical protein
MNLPDTVDWDLVLLKSEVETTFELLFPSPPAVNCDDWLDGESLEIVNGVDFRKLPRLLADELDGVPLLALLSVEEGKYYLGGYLLKLLETIARMRRLYPSDTPVIAMEWIGFLGFLKGEAGADWIRGIKPLRSVVSRILDLMINTAGFEFDESDLQEIRTVRNSIEPFV